jgi:AcrR family transcriptional regulator
MSRYREFDTDAALECALNLFWRKGYEGTSLSDLTKAMGIARPSLYAAFGNKEELFRKALQRYDSTCMTFMRESLHQPSARAVVSHLLYGFADAQTNPPHPPGSLETTGAIACSEEAEQVKQELTRRRIADEAALRSRLEDAKIAGDLPVSCDPGTLAQFVMSVAHGMAIQAASGADRNALHRVVEMALGITALSR